ncbi:MAG: hypothetical protein LAO09_18300 [Acidobacteriia bacterium]|nr:hypothetical protein [Terriglobia bacterium]
MIRIEWWTWVCGIFLLYAVTAIASPAQTFTTLTNFNGSDGATPVWMSLVQGADGNLYGTTEGGGYSCFPYDGCGTVFKVTPAGKLTSLYRFCDTCETGDFPASGLFLAIDGNFYGTTVLGGVANAGTVFKITSAGKLTSQSICSQPDCGKSPYGSLLQAADHNFYGTTEVGGANGEGTVFEVTPTGILTVLHGFGGYPDGDEPEAGLVQSVDGSLYGTTWAGGAYNSGMIFRVNPGGKVTTFYSFCAELDCTDGESPVSALFQGKEGNFYGTTWRGGDITCGSGVGCGTVFKITPAGLLTTLHTFEFTDGAHPIGAVMQATDGNIYGTTSEGGDATCNAPNGCGTIFRVTSAGMLTTLHTFESTDGASPWGGLLQATNGILYGTTASGGDLTCNSSNGCGTIFSLDVGLRQFVAFVRDSGKVGATGGILGQRFTGTTDVSINGTPAAFTVVSDTFLKATVPPGATTGFVTVTTPSGTLTSNKPFRVTPQLLTFDPPSGPVGTQVTITGVSLTQTQGVGFGNRVPAQFTVDSDTQVTATVPAGAKTGKVGIETKGGTAISQATFTVTE